MKHFTGVAAFCFPLALFSASFALAENPELDWNWYYTITNRSQAFGTNTLTSVNIFYGTATVTVRSTTINIALTDFQRPGDTIAFSGSITKDGKVAGVLSGFSYDKHDMEMIGEYRRLKYSPPLDSRPSRCINEEIVLRERAPAGWGDVVPNGNVFVAVNQQTDPTC